MNWVKKIADYFNFDINHHLQVDENTQLPLPIRLIERAGFETNPYFHTPTFMVDFLALFFVYGELFNLKFMKTCHSVRMRVTQYCLDPEGVIICFQSS